MIRQVQRQGNGFRQRTATANLKQTGADVDNFSILSQSLIPLCDLTCISVIIRFSVIISSTYVQYNADPMTARYPQK